jgi:hypothetical protein
MSNGIGNLPIQGTASRISDAVVHATAISESIDAQDLGRAIRKAVAEMEARLNEALPKHARYYWGKRNGFQAYDFDWTEIRHDSVVIITASEGKPPITSLAPERFVGAAPFYVMNIAPYDGGVIFAVRIDWPEPLDLWTDITVFNRHIWFRPSPFVSIR